VKQPSQVSLNGNVVLVLPEVMRELDLREGQIITEDQMKAVAAGNARSYELAAARADPLQKSLF